MMPAGNIRAKFNYNPFGDPVTGGHLPTDNYNVLYNPFGYTGEQHDQETGFVYLRARYYDPSIGKFISKDPWPADISNPQTLNRYAYVTNNPMRFVDPLGLFQKDDDSGNPVTLNLPSQLYNQQKDSWLSYNSQIALANASVQWYNATNDEQRAAALNQLNTIRSNISVHPDRERILGFLDQGVKNLSGGSIASELLVRDNSLRMAAGEASQARVNYISGQFEPDSIPSKINIKIQGQMPERGWTEDDINGTINNPYTTRTALNKANENPATAYYNEDGSYVVRDDVTRDIIQISDKFDPDWIPDFTIKDPYKPQSVDTGGEGEEW